MDFQDILSKAFKDPESVDAMTEEYNPLVKSEKLAKQGREIGNALYLEVAHYDLTHEKIWNSYLKSISLSPANSESLATSYGNMSALLYHLAEFEACVKDCDKALKITESIPLRIKLLCRKAKCFASLDRAEVKETLEEAETWLSKMGDDDDKKRDLALLINKAKAASSKIRLRNESSRPPSIDSVIFTASSANTLDDPTINKKKGRRPKFDYQPLKGESTHMDVLAKKAKNGVFNSVIVKQDDALGRHFVASRNIRPGEIIFVTKPLIAVPNFRRVHNYCNHCLDPLWSSVPCDGCSCCLWCSDECKEEATRQYHDVECSIVPFVVFGDEGSDYAVQGALRAVIKAVREFGSIADLKDEIENIDNSQDLNYGYSRDGKFKCSSFVSIFSFKNTHADPAVLDYLAKSSCRNVIALARFTDFLGKDKEFDSVKSLREDDEAFFIASLMLRVAVIVYNNGVKIPEPERRCPENNEQTCASTFPCCERGYAVNTVANFVPHSCDPSVKTMRTSGGREICYALQPIYKGEPLLECYGSTFFEMGLGDRSDRTARILNSYCTCIACTENWPPVLAPEGKSLDFDEILDAVVFSREHHYEKIRILDLVEKYGFAHQHVVDELAKVMQASFEYFGQPSAETCAAMCLLYYAFDALYANNLRFAAKCKAPLGAKFSKNCQKM